MVNPKTKGEKKRRKPKQNHAVPAELLADERFKDVALDPKFRSIPRSEAKIKIDERFGKMFTDKRFKIKATMDKRGRPVNTTSSEDLKRFYHLDEGEGESGSDSEGDEKGSASGKIKPKTKTRSEECRDTGADRVGRSDEIRGKLVGDEDSKAPSSDDADPSSADELLDFARGEGNIETSEDDSTDSSEDEEEKLMREEAEQEVEWDELDKDAPRSDDISKRIALCNMDWQNLRAEDLFVLMHSFVPADGVVHRVRIFPTQFGKERMLAETKHGPKLKSKDAQALRKYEFDRLKYYYAVVECDNERTANAIYESCDGTEFQTSGTKLDLRFIPDDMEFDESEQTDFCDSLPTEYEPVDFVNAALMQSTCESTFDSEDLRRKKTLGKLYSKESKKTQKKKGRKQDDDQLDHMAAQLKTYIASESEEEDPKSAADKYRKLLLSADDQEENEASEDGDKEIVFNPELNAAVEKARKEKNDREIKSKKTPFQEYLEKKKQKKRERRLAEKAKRKKETTFSDDELPAGVDENDEFFKQNLSDSDDTKRRQESVPSADDDAEEEEEEREKRRGEELELLLMDEQGDSRKHFSLKKILKNEKQSKKKNETRGGKGSQAAAQDDFEVNVNDPRFSAIYSDHRFNIDPTDASFKRTKAMNAVLEEKTKRRRKT
ncbi:ESF1 homolog [Galendromus occidentalis]|uniref:ESF1 homolog n=1 Tax=Galendromus occidentalis TaxID=34638 RepID=A0AAJ6QYQ5_9ACAR|nr:ESF1 homolog [Galendromus occidentalis]